MAAAMAETPSKAFGGGGRGAREGGRGGKGGGRGGPFSFAHPEAAAGRQGGDLDGGEICPFACRHHRSF